jgi:hypothetical protein
MWKVKVMGNVVCRSEGGRVGFPASFFFGMEIFHIPDYTLMRPQGGVSKLRHILLFPFKPWPV